MPPANWRETLYGSDFAEPRPVEPGPEGGLLLSSEKGRPFPLPKIAVGAFSTPRKAALAADKGAGLAANGRAGHFIGNNSPGGGVPG